MLRRPVTFEIAQAISQGHIVMTYKTKARLSGGKQLVSVGPYRTACGEKTYAVISNRGDDGFYTTPNLAAADFVDFVGRDIAWEALKNSRKG
jgi:hypothetical protein